MVTGKYTALKFTIQIKRNPMFYDLMIVKPALMLSMMTMFIFLMPPSATDRYSYGKNLHYNIVMEFCYLNVIFCLVQQRSNRLTFNCLFFSFYLSRLTQNNGPYFDVIIYIYSQKRELLCQNSMSVMCNVMHSERHSKCNRRKRYLHTQINAYTAHVQNLR